VDFAPIQPVQLWVEELSMKTNPNYQAEVGKTRLFKVDFKVHSEEGVNPEGQLLYKVRLGVTAEPFEPAHPLPYELSITVSSVFAFADNATLPREERIRFVGYSGLSMIYSFARDAVLYQTALGPHGRMILPSVNIGVLAEQLINAEWVPPEESPAPSKRTRKRATRQPASAEG